MERAQRVEVTLQFTTDCLAGTPDAEGLHTFRRDSAGNLLFDARYWRTMIQKAMQDTDPELLAHLDDIRPPTLRRVPTSIEIVRDGAAAYEALREGTELTVAFFVPAAVGDGRFLSLLAHAGEWIGFSPAKAHIGYGRFRVKATITR
jgi:hypothetical protein